MVVFWYYCLQTSTPNRATYNKKQVTSCEVTFKLKFAQGQNTLIPFFPTLHRRAHSRQPPDRREHNKNPTNLYPTLVTVHQCAESWLVANPQTKVGFPKATNLSLCPYMYACIHRRDASEQIEYKNPSGIYQVVMGFFETHIFAL